MIWLKIVLFSLDCPFFRLKRFYEQTGLPAQSGKAPPPPPPLPDTSPLQQTENTGNFKLEGEEERMLALALEEMGTINPHGLTHFLFNKIAFLFAFLIKKRKRKVTPT